MSDNERLTDRQLRVIPYLLTSPSTEEACRRARINKTTVYEWLRNETFREELKRQRDVCKPDMVYVLDRGHGLHFYSLSFPCQPLAGVILLVR